ncbi:uncharacterized protein LOC143074575 [Mytilus galloprovincialis]|uniref:uncharacterized protein LOC143074575 n=1 Tax=Mytilus galloprovincialis TaxID=29158 RepID=UPI003F7BF3B1
MDAQPIQGAGIENNIYRFVDELPGPSSTSHNRGEVYSSIDRRLQVSSANTVNYKVSKNDNMNQQSEARDVHNRVVEDDVSKLNYVEVAFDSKRTSKELYIHGAEKKTQYVDIDLLAKADHLCSEDENDSVSSTRDNNDDDFVSLEEIQKWRITEDT